MWGIYHQKRLTSNQYGFTLRGGNLTTAVHMRTAADPNRFEREPALLTRANPLASGAAGIVASWDDRGTFVCDAVGVALDFIPRHLRRDGVWLVRAADVAAWLAVP